MTALAEQLIKNNLAMPKTDSPLYMAALEFFKKGGGRARAHDILDRAYERLNPNDDAKAILDVRESANVYLPYASSPKVDGSGQNVNAQSRLKSNAAPVRPPLNLTGDIALNAKTTLALSVFDRIKTSDGRAWGDVGAHELDGMARDGAMAKALKDRLGVLTNAQRFMKIRDIISHEKFEQARNDAHGS